MRLILRFTYWALLIALSILGIFYDVTMAGYGATTLLTIDLVAAVVGALQMAEDPVLFDFSRGNWATYADRLGYLVATGLAVGAGWWTSVGLLLFGSFFWALAREIQRSPLQDDPTRV